MERLYFFLKALPVLIVWNILEIPFVCAAEASEISYSEYAFYADDVEQAEAIAQANNACLVSYQYGIGVLGVDGAAAVSGVDGAAATLEKTWEGIRLYPEHTYHIDYIDTLSQENMVYEQWHLEAVEVKEAWDRTKGQGIKVAVIDTGIDQEHEDLQGAVCYVDSVIPEELYEAGGIFYGKRPGIYDNLGHGTHVAGIIGARDNGTGCTGIAPGSSIIAIKALEQDGAVGKGKSSWIAAAIRMATDQGASVINLSVGGTLVGDELLKEAVDYAQSGNAVVVCAAGNISGTPKIFYPGAYENTLAVSAVGREGASMVFASSYSNYGSWIDISAPGTAIMSTIPGGYGGKTGTSMACPIVSGAVALLFSLDQTISFDDVKTLLSDSATDFGEAGYDEKYGHGVINVKALIDNYLVDKELPMPTAAVPDGSVVGAGYYIRIHTDIDGADIVYTLDGSDPTETSDRYPHEGIAFSEENTSVTIKARTWKEGMPLSETVTCTYAIVPVKTILDNWSDTVSGYVPLYGPCIDPVHHVPCHRYEIVIPPDNVFYVKAVCDTTNVTIRILDGAEENAHAFTLKEDGQGYSLLENRTSFAIPAYIFVMPVEWDQDRMVTLEYRLSELEKKDGQEPGRKEEESDRTENAESAGSTENIERDSLTKGDAGKIMAEALETAEADNSDQEGGNDTTGGKRDRNGKNRTGEGKIFKREKVSKETIPEKQNPDRKKEILDGSCQKEDANDGFQYEEPLYEEDWLYTMETSGADEEKGRTGRRTGAVLCGVIVASLMMVFLFCHTKKDSSDDEK